MKEIRERIKQEIEDLHHLFVNWFTGKADKSELKRELNTRFSQETKFISTAGDTINYESLMLMFENGYGKTSKEFKIVISDFELVQEIGDYVLANYVEWQTTSSNTKASGNFTARRSTVLISRQSPFKWLHIHESMIPQSDGLMKRGETLFK